MKWIAAGLMVFSATTAFAVTNNLYRITNGEELVIIVRSISPGNKVYQSAVDTNGCITLPYLGQIAASGKTSTELEQTIQQAYIANNISTALTVNVILRADLQGAVLQPLPGNLTNPLQGDLWLPGEYERELEKRENKRTTQPSPSPSAKPRATE